MPNGMVSSMDFDAHIKALGDRELAEYVARQLYAISVRCTEHYDKTQNHEDRIDVLEKAPPNTVIANQKQTIATSAATGSIMAIIIGVGEWFLNRMGR